MTNSEEIRFTDGEIIFKGKLNGKKFKMRSKVERATLSVEHREPEPLYLDDRTLAWGPNEIDSISITWTPVNGYEVRREP